MLRKPHHLLAFLRCEAQLACVAQGIEIGEAKKHIGLGRGQRPEFTDIFFSKEPFRGEACRRRPCEILVKMHAVVRVLGEVFDLHARGRDVAWLHAQDALDNAVAFLAGLFPRPSNQFIGCEAVHLAWQIWILAQAPTEVGDDLRHAFHTDITAFRLHHSAQFQLHPFLVCHAVYLPLQYSSSDYYTLFLQKKL